MTVTSPSMGHSDPLLSPSMHGWLDSFRERYEIPGLSVVVVTVPVFGPPNNDPNKTCGGEATDGWRSEIFTSGISNVRSDPFDSKSLFSISSNTKLFTAISLGLLIEQKAPLPDGQVLHWDTKIGTILPGWALVDSLAGDEATIQDLLTMRTGVPFHGFAPNHPDLESLLEMMRNLPPSASFRERWQYDNDNYLILSHIVSTLSGKPFDVFVRDELLRPLGMQSATFDVIEAGQKGKRTEAFIGTQRESGSLHSGDVNHSSCGPGSSSIYRVTRKGIWKSIGWRTKGTGEQMWGGAGLIMDPNDVILYRLAVQIAGEMVERAFVADSHPAFGAGSLFSPSDKIEASNLVLSQVKNTSYGYGQWISTYRGYKVISHYGYQLGQHTLFIRLPDQGLALAFMNLDNENGVNSNALMAYRVMDELLGLEPKDWEAVVMGEWWEKQRIENITDDMATRDKLLQEYEKPRNDKLHGDILLGGYHHPAWGVLTFRPFVTSGEYSQLAQLIRSQTDLLRPVSIAEMPGREKWYMVFRPPRQFNGYPYSIIQIHDHHTSSGIEKDAIVRVLTSGTAWVDASGMGFYDNFWSSYTSASNVSSRAFPDRSSDSTADSLESRSSTMESEKCMVMNPKESAEVWFDRVGVRIRP